MSGWDVSVFKRDEQIYHWDDEGFYDMTGKSQVILVHSSPSLFFLPCGIVSRRGPYVYVWVMGVGLRSQSTNRYGSTFKPFIKNKGHRHTSRFLKIMLPPSPMSLNVCRQSTKKLVNKLRNTGKSSFDRKRRKHQQNQSNLTILFYGIWPTGYLLSLNKQCRDLRPSRSNLTVVPTQNHFRKKTQRLSVEQR